jgi:hypothetical protein
MFRSKVCQIERCVSLVLVRLRHAKAANTTAHRGLIQRDIGIRSLLSQWHQYSRGLPKLTIPPPAAYRQQCVFSLRNCYSPMKLWPGRSTTIVSDHTPLLEPEPEFPMNGSRRSRLHFDSQIVKSISSSQARISLPYCINSQAKPQYIVQYLWCCQTQALIRTRPPASMPMATKGLGVQLYARCTQPRLPRRCATRDARVADLGT